MYTFATADAPRGCFYSFKRPNYHCDSFSRSSSFLIACPTPALLSIQRESRARENNEESMNDTSGSRKRTCSAWFLASQAGQSRGDYACAVVMQLTYCLYYMLLLQFASIRNDLVNFILDVRVDRVTIVLVMIIIVQSCYLIKNDWWNFESNSKVFVLMHLYELKFLHYAIGNRNEKICWWIDSVSELCR